ncbi:hypothetical protein ART_1234 [Arthrobacter sp. PAMC 25486]|nr:hypothetical protein ART_1234 [Arthrobacter sp. PAMC 25486]
MRIAALAVLTSLPLSAVGSVVEDTNVKQLILQSAAPARSRSC